MKLTYVAHASLLIEYKELKVLTDPWFNGPAYYNQWHVFPKPADTSFSPSVTHIILTHGHEDHLHIPTLKLMNKNAKIFFPYTWKSGTKDLLKSMGFEHIQKISSFKKNKTRRRSLHDIYREWIGCLCYLRVRRESICQFK